MSISVYCSVHRPCVRHACRQYVTPNCVWFVSFVVTGSVVARSNNSFRAYLTIGLVNVVQASVCLSVMIVRCFQERMPLSRAPGRPLITYYYDSACLGLCRKRSVNCSVLRLAVFLICPGVQVWLCPHPTVRIRVNTVYGFNFLSSIDQYWHF